MTSMALTGSLLWVCQRASPVRGQLPGVFLAQQYMAAGADFRAWCGLSN